MPDQSTIRRARRDKRQGKSGSTQAGEFVRDEIRKIRRGEHGARNTKQAIAIGLSEARRSGVKVPARKGRTSAATRRKAKQDSAASRRRRPVSQKRSRATMKALRREPRSTVSKRSLSRQARQSARRRSPAERSRAAHKAANTRRHRSGR
jgi:hypothetical protein